MYRVEMRYGYVSTVERLRAHNLQQNPMVNSNLANCSVTKE